jgi:hypothetical protein
MAKIGVSKRDAYARAQEVIKRGLAEGAVIAVDGVVLGATYEVEQWLHRFFGDVRDINTARDEQLPHPSEWFWPTPALELMLDGEPFAHLLDPRMVGPALDPRRARPLTCSESERA